MNKLGEQDGSTGRVVMFPPASIWRGQEGEFLLDRKFYDGMILYRELWGGPVRCIMSASGGPPPPFGLISRRPDDLPFELVIRAPKEKIAVRHLEGAKIVLASGDSFDQFHVGRLCRGLGVPCVYIIEYTPRTRLQILALETKNPLLRLRRTLFFWRGEMLRRQAFRGADAIQSNGTPCAVHYRDLCSNILTYFDTRVTKAGLITPEQLEARLATLDQDRPLEIAFSGRLIKMKGADHLVEVARRLRDAGLNFKLTIYGTGDLDDSLHSYIRDHKLESHVQLAGVLDFEKELMPRVREETDLYLILHRQSDPSCTYLETFAGGVPVVGYANEAFLGLLGQAEVGWSAKLDDIDGIVEHVIRLDKNRAEIQRKARAARAFAEQHTFEAVSAQRDAHLKQLL